MNRYSTIARTSIAAALLMNAEGTDPSVGGTAAPEVKLSRVEKLAAQIATIEKRIETDTAKVADLKQELETAQRLADVREGTLIIAKLGRAETVREVPATVLGKKEDDNGVRYKIEFGDGFDKDVTVIQPAQIVAITGQITE